VTEIVRNSVASRREGMSGGEGILTSGGKKTCTQRHKQKVVKKSVLVWRQKKNSKSSHERRKDIERQTGILLEMPQNITTKPCGTWPIGWYHWQHKGDTESWGALLSMPEQGE